MIKQKLIKLREERRISQSEIAKLLGITQPQYSRRESGITRISKKEWDKMAKILNTDLESIYEPEDGVYIINEGSPSQNYSHSHNYFHQLPDYVLDTMKKYIERLEEENKELKEELSRLKSN